MFPEECQESSDSVLCVLLLFLLGVISCAGMHKRFLSCRSIGRGPYSSHRHNVYPKRAYPVLPQVEALSG